LVNVNSAGQANQKRCNGGIKKMKKVIILIIFLIMPVTAYADFQIGPFAAYKFPISSTKNLPGLDNVGLEDFWFGLDTRLKASIFQATLLGLYIPGTSSNSVPNKIAVNLTGGLAFDLALIRLGLGVGPVWIFSLGSTAVNPVDFGTLARFNVDFMFGWIALGLSLASQVNLTGRGAVFNFNNFSLLAGLALLFRLD
jgi:hypothetical protein